MFALVSLNAGAADDDKAFQTPRMPYRAFDALPATEIRLDGGTVLLAFAPGDFALPRVAIAEWVERCARTVATYYGRFPVRTLRLLILPTAGKGVRGGTSYGYRGPAIKLRLGQNTESADLAGDWVLIHEMVHMAFPTLNERHHWLEEGLATYVEPVARAQARGISVATVWGALVQGLPKGLPKFGDEGLDRTRTWGRTYWGGALFCLLAEVRIRERTANRVGLQDALRAIVEAGGNIEEDWPVERALQIGDRATGTHVLQELYAQLSTSAVDTDLAALWQQLGVSLQNGRVILDDNAPGAEIRRAITIKR